MKPWGHKIWFAVYVEGDEPSGTTIIKAANALGDSFDNVVNVCPLPSEKVMTEPYDQGAS